MPDRGHRVLERRDPRDDLGAARGVLAHDGGLCRSQGLRLREDGVGHPDLADVVEERGGAEPGGLVTDPVDAVSLGLALMFGLLGLPHILMRFYTVPTAKEAGVSDFQLNIWSGIYAPKGTPKEIVAKLADALNKALDDPATAEKLGKLGGTVPPKSERGPEYLRKTVASDIPRWAPTLKEAAEASKQN